MAVYTGTATGHNNLLEELRDALVAEGWTINRDDFDGTQRELHVKGPSISIGTEMANYHASILSYQSIGSDYYNWISRAYSAFSDNLGWSNQLNSSPSSRATFWNDTTPYWFFINDRRFIVVAKVTTVYVSYYSGFILPYGTPTEAPYPAYICGNSQSGQRFSAANYTLGSIADPAYDSAWFMNNAQGWERVANYINSSNSKLRSDYDCAVEPHGSFAAAQMLTSPSGEYTLRACILNGRLNGGNDFGELDGVYWVSGHGQSSENTISVGGDTYIVFQMNERTSREDYFAVKMQ